MLLPVVNWNGISDKKNTLVGAISEESLRSMGKVVIMKIMQMDGYSDATDIVDKDSKMLKEVNSQYKTKCES